MLLLRLKLSCVRDDWRERLIRGGGGRFKPRSKDMILQYCRIMNPPGPQDRGGSGPWWHGHGHDIVMGCD